MSNNQASEANSDERQGEPAHIPSFFGGWTGFIAVTSFVFFTILFVFQLGFFMYIGFGFLGLIGASDLLFNMTVIVPPLVGIVVGAALGLESYVKTIATIANEILARPHLWKITSRVVLGLYLCVSTYFVFTDPVIALFILAPSFCCLVLIAWQIIAWHQTKIINYYNVATFAVMFGLATITSGFVSARQKVCCSKELYSLKTKDDGFIDGVRILRSSEAGIIYALPPIVVFLPKDRIVQLSRQQSNLGE
jgi:hypothetical protein